MRNIKTFCTAAILLIKWLWNEQIWGLKLGFADFGKFRLYILDGKRGRDVRLQVYYIHSGYQIDDRFKCSKKYKVAFDNLTKAVKEVM